MDKFNRIQEYLEGKMNQYEKMVFESELDSDQALQKELSLQKRANEIALKKNRIDVKRKVKGIYFKENKIEQKNSLNSKRLWMVLFLSIFALFLLISILKLNKTTEIEIPNELFADIVSTKSDNLSNPLISGMIYYNNASYQEAINYFLKITPDSIDYELSRIYLANAYYGSEQYEKAISTLNKILYSSKYIEVANWYKALSYLNLENHLKAKDNLKLLIENENSNYKKSQAIILLNQINNLQKD